jgi:hypothetical protein
MKTSTSLKVVILFSGMVIVLAAQWRTVSRLRHENQQLLGVREQAVQTRAELEQATQVSAQHESEAQMLRAEVVTLRSEVQSVRQELEQSKTSMIHRAVSPSPAPVRFGSGTISPSSPGDPGFLVSLHPRQQYHLWPAVRTNMTPFSTEAPAYSARFFLDDIELCSRIPQEAVLSSPDWSPLQPLPLSFDDAEQVARDELRKLTHDESSWEVGEISLGRLSRGSQKWFYSIRLFPTGKPGFVQYPDSFITYVSFTGRPGITGLQ